VFGADLKAALLGVPRSNSLRCGVLRYVGLGLPALSWQCLSTGAMNANPGIGLPWNRPTSCRDGRPQLATWLLDTRAPTVDTP
jgi:hypothetical protein